MAVNVANILVGMGTLYHWQSNAWEDLGATMDGAELTFEPDFGEVEVDQMKDAARLFNQGLQVSLRTTLVEATLENLALAMGYNESDVITSDASNKTFSIKVPDEDPVETRIKLEGNAPKVSGVKKKRTYEARRVVSVEGSNHGLKKTEATVFPVNFRLLPDPTYSGSEYGTIVDQIS